MSSNMPTKSSTVCGDFTLRCLTRSRAFKNRFLPFSTNLVISSRFSDKCRKPPQMQGHLPQTGQAYGYFCRIQTENDPCFLNPCVSLPAVLQTHAQTPASL